jgi:hypothetical protein
MLKSMLILPGSLKAAHHTQRNVGQGLSGRTLRFPPNNRGDEK